jgi:hypothetical protein
MEVPSACPRRAVVSRGKVPRVGAVFAHRGLAHKTRLLLAPLSIALLTMWVGPLRVTGFFCLCARAPALPVLALAIIVALIG